MRTLHGRVGFERTVWECPRCRASRALLDEELELELHGALSGQVRKKVSWEVTRASFGEASTNLKHQCGLSVSAAECARVAQTEGERLARVQEQREREWAEPGAPDRPAAPPEHQSKRLVMQADATSVLTVRGEEHKMVWCATAFALEDRTSKEGSQRPAIVRRRYAGGSGDFEQFDVPMKALANRMGARRSEKSAFIADGAPCLWRWARENMPPDTEMIQDFWHVSERLYKLAGELYGGDKTVAETWNEAVRAGRLDEVLDSLRAEHRRRRGKLRKRAAEEIAYLETGRERMDYARLEGEGWPIGSGAVEGTCKHLVKQRFNKTGARWKRDNIKPVLALRQSIFNEDWERDWAKKQIQPH